MIGARGVSQIAKNGGVMTFRRRNPRYDELMEKLRRGGLTTDETAELDRLQGEYEAHLDAMIARVKASRSTHRS